MENVGESSFTLGLARDASVHVITSSDVGWVQSGSSWYYYDSLGNMVTGWLKDGTGSLATWYFCNLYTGVMLSNERAMIDGDYYYFQSDGAMKTGWQEFSDGWYYFTPIGQSEPEGSAVNGRVLIGSEIYLFINYVMQHGKVEFSYSTAGFAEGIYYFGDPGDEDSGCMMYGWLHDTEVSNNTWYYLGTNGRAYTGWYIISGTTYHFDSEAEMSYGNVRMGYSDFEFDSSGALISDEPYAIGDPMWGTEEFNLRWNNLILDGYGHRIPNLTVCADNVTNQIMNSFYSMINYYNSLQDADGTGKLVNMGTTSIISSADVIVSVLPASEWMYRSSAIGVTYQGNDGGQWTYGRIPPGGYADYFPTDGMGNLVSGKVSYSVIILQEEYITQTSFTNAQADNLLRHEMGHVIGLRHPWEVGEEPEGSPPECLMYPYNSAEYTTFYDYDYQEFYKTYPQAEAEP